MVHGYVNLTGHGGPKSWLNIIQVCLGQGRWLLDGRNTWQVVCVKQVALPAGSGYRWPVWAWLDQNREFFSMPVFRLGQHLSCFELGLHLEFTPWALLLQPPAYQLSGNIWASIIGEPLLYILVICLSLVFSLASFLSLSLSPVSDTVSK